MQALEWMMGKRNRSAVRPVPYATLLRKVTSIYSASAGWRRHRNSVSVPLLPNLTRLDTEPHLVPFPRNENNRKDGISSRGCLKSSQVVGLSVMPSFFLLREENVT